VAPGRDLSRAKAEAISDRGRDVSERNTLIGDAVEHTAAGNGAASETLDGDAIEPSGVLAVYGRPAALAGSDVRRDASLTRDLHEHMGKALVARAVDGRRQAYHRGAHAAARARKRQPLTRDTPGGDRSRAGRYVLGADGAVRDARDARSRDEHLRGRVAGGEAAEERVDGAQVHARGRRDPREPCQVCEPHRDQPRHVERGEVVVEGAMDDRVGPLRGGEQHADVGEVALARESAAPLYLVDQADGHRGVLITAGASATGMALVGFARSFGLPTVAIVRDAAGRQKLLGLGADEVVAQSDASFDVDVKAATDRWAATAVFDGVGGALLTRLVPDLAQASTVYSYGYLGGPNVPLQLPTTLLMTKTLTLRSFSNTATPTVRALESLDAALRHIGELLALPHCKTPLGLTYTFEQIDEAMAAVGAGEGKPVLLPK
jgi:hypothetical protein